METQRGWRPLTAPEGTGHRPGTHVAVTPFMRLARTHAASTASDAMVAAALAGTIFFEGATSDARERVFLYLVLTMAPFALVAPLIGPALDRATSGRRWIVIGSAVVRALLCLVIIGRTDTLLLYPAAFGVLVLQKGYGVARSAIVPGVVESDEELVEANSKLQLLSGLMGFAGAAPAALLFTLFDSPDAPLALAVLGFAATAGLGLRIPGVAVAPTSATPEEKAELRSVGVLLAAGGMGLLRAIVGFLTVHFAFHYREAEQLTQFGIVAAVSVIGSLVGSVIAPRLRQVWPEERMLISALLAAVGVGVLATTSGGTVGAAMLGFSIGVANTAGKLAFDSIVQRDAPDANRGRLFARFETRFQLFWVIGSLLGLVPFTELRLSFLTVALVSGFAAFSYIVGLSAWRHRTGASDTQFGRQAVLIDEKMTQAQSRAKDRVRTSSRALVSRVRSRDRTGALVDRPHAGPGIGVGMTPVEGSPAVEVPRRRRRLTLGRRSTPPEAASDVPDPMPSGTAGADDPTLIDAPPRPPDPPVPPGSSVPPGPATVETRIPPPPPPADDPTTFAPAPYPGDDRR